jgi:hypothetical protein
MMLGVLVLLSFFGLAISSLDVRLQWSSTNNQVVEITRGIQNAYTLGKLSTLSNNDELWWLRNQIEQTTPRRVISTMWLNNYVAYSGNHWVYFFRVQVDGTSRILFVVSSKL